MPRGDQLPPAAEHGGDWDTLQAGRLQVPAAAAQMSLLLMAAAAGRQNRRAEVQAEGGQGDAGLGKIITHMNKNLPKFFLWVLAGSRRAMQRGRGQEGGPWGGGETSDSRVMH